MLKKRIFSVLTAKAQKVLVCKAMFYLNTWVSKASTLF